VILHVLLSSLLQAAAQAPTPSAPGAPPASAEYRIGPQDILKIAVYTHDDLSQVVVVQPDGTFTFPLVGRVKAADATPDELAQTIGALLAKGFIKDPQVTVTVQEYRSKTVFVVGEVARPGAYPLSGSMTLVEILAKAGPTTAEAAAEVVVVRPPPTARVSGPLLPGDLALPQSTVSSTSGTGARVAPAVTAATVFRVNIQEIQSGALGKNLTLLPNDTIFIPKAPRVFVSGEVRNPGAYPHAPGLTVRQLISLAGGLTDVGSSGRLEVVRTIDGKTRRSGIRQDDPIKPGDTLVVKRRRF
jgi:polysaccharide biosynthesis/export protein